MPSGVLLNIKFNVCNELGVFLFKYIFEEFDLDQGSTDRSGARSKAFLILRTRLDRGPVNKK